jgi:hypothetical protein
MMTNLMSLIVVLTSITSSGIASWLITSVTHQKVVSSASSGSGREKGELASEFEIW